MELKRRPFQGVLNILSFNRHFYIFGCIALALLLSLYSFMGLHSAIFWITIGAFAYGLLMPLIVSAYVYDLSGYYDLKWLKNLNINEEEFKHIVNMNAGFDETSFLLEDKIPNAELRVFDFYNAKQHTEAAITRARKISLTYPNTLSINTSKIPLQNQSADGIFLLSAAHEIRDNTEKIEFLKECHRINKSNGNLIIVEHLRDLPNFLAFTIGFTHFYSKKTWLSVLQKAGYSTIKEYKFTPFLSIFTAQP
ncbi:methyltransferase domain-containing protein [Leeuwenhoekiella parthenopeia]|uniref:Methyltransferase domain-containing protein n=1 Tax=Leeuwenhoekiella parthenopeia TaxID=2890320 RepID=A0ABS8GTJ8_9FLAO|nr:methyltransferase domain-containing protein [Leeuwenhoekiella parthenopeia]MCC4212542.1 methyltransferase domain-containing protein [Leeuwenhoekiella parthenopeia]